MPNPNGPIPPLAVYQTVLALSLDAVYGVAVYGTNDYGQGGQNNSQQTIAALILIPNLITS